MPNPHCLCPAAGLCSRHKLNKSDREFELCKGTAHSIDCGRKYWLAWERGMLGATPPESPVLDPPPFCVDRGFGDHLARMIDHVTLGAIPQCGGCKRREALLNHWFPKELPPIEKVDLSESNRHLMFHIWPIKDFGAWQWNCDRLLEHAACFNGRRVVAIVTDDESEPAEAVREYLKDFTDEFLEFPNDPRLREVVTFVPMLERLEGLQSERDVTFTCHAKAVRHKLTPEQEGTTIFRWAGACYETMTHWEAVRPLLETNGTVGVFRRFNNVPDRKGFGVWHFSGAFYWFRNQDVFRRNWRYVPDRFYGTEAWPGLMFKTSESACVACDNIGDLYNFEYWTKSIEPQLAMWRNSLPAPVQA